MSIEVVISSKLLKIVASVNKVHDKYHKVLPISTSNNKAESESCMKMKHISFSLICSENCLYHKNHEHFFNTSSYFVGNRKEIAGTKNEKELSFLSPKFQLIFEKKSLSQISSQGWRCSQKNFLPSAAIWSAYKAFIVPNCVFLLTLLSVIRCLREFEKDKHLKKILHRRMWQHVM